MTNTYWNEYYAGKRGSSAPLYPSQFAAFVATEINDHRHVIVELGCGNGRDALFFSEYGFRVIGIDSSSEAIRSCNERQGRSGNAIFKCASLSDTSLIESIKELTGNASVVVYARFFLHAISDDEELNFLEFAKQLCGNHGYVAVEFRTDKDKDLSKVTASHFRRFIDPAKFIERAVKYDFTTIYFTEGFGYAKFRQDDAHVSRVILKSILETIR